ncbi:sodium- and chloride-dependent GABA transporter 3-like [Liolophura sinensis]|uniref:sodium- and chloride-dependent GABA transporter 3-like n=1 Tax=Liolophura sinensis TaxID=3198878 RepID=UPI0031597B73
MPIPHLWAALFFILVFFLGIDSAFGMIKTFTSGLFDMYPTTLGRYKVLVTLGICMASYLSGLIFVTKGGMYWFQLFDWYLCFFALMLVALLECLVVSYIYGIERFLRNVREMLKPVNNTFLTVMKYCIMVEVPIVMAGALIFTVATFRSPKYGKYVYPEWTNVFGWLLGMSMTLPIPIIIVYNILSAKGTFIERLRETVKPVITRKGGVITDLKDEDCAHVMFPQPDIVSVTKETTEC